ncbi:hypothetical protein F0562_006206 [Nyssa sinensis]|uniref:Uncharacterized protein n=1 Tax=Nyssa sinensis TaxID=561372 RepID=A0A5J5AQZ2_9ASTE|nr:hypothetical protein F0562_006206 [Nyssa sinensis]
MLEDTIANYLCHLKIHPVIFTSKSIPPLRQVKGVKSGMLALLHLGSDHGCFLQVSRTQIFSFVPYLESLVMYQQF